MKKLIKKIIYRFSNERKHNMAFGYVFEFMKVKQKSARCEMDNGLVVYLEILTEDERQELLEWRCEYELDN